MTEAQVEGTLFAGFRGRPSGPAWGGGRGTPDQTVTRRFRAIRQGRGAHSRGVASRTGELDHQTARAQHLGDGQGREFRLRPDRDDIGRLGLGAHEGRGPVADHDHGDSAPAAMGGQFECEIRTFPVRKGIVEEDDRDRLLVEAAPCLGEGGGKAHLKRLAIGGKLPLHDHPVESCVLDDEANGFRLSHPAGPLCRWSR